MTVDEYVETRVSLDLQTLVRELREVIKQSAPSAAEVISYGMPCYRGKKVFAWIHPTKKDVTVGFARGTQLHDRHGLLTGGAKAGARHVRMSSIADVNRQALDD